MLDLACLSIMAVACRLNGQDARLSPDRISAFNRVIAGSIPAQATLVSLLMLEAKKPVLAISRTVPFRQFQARLGSATYRLNTIFVGLEHVAEGAGKLPHGAAISWAKPADSDKAKQAADQARIFACTAAMAFAVDVAEQYIFSIVQVSWLDFPMSVKEIATKAKTRPASEGGAYSLAERAQAICDHLGMSCPLLLGLLDLLAKWRNKTIHSGERNVDIANDSRSAILEGAATMHEKYSHFDVALALENFKHKKLPVAKEITSLIAACQNFFRQIDEAAIKKAAGTSIGLRYTLNSMMRDYFFAGDRREVLIASRMAEFMQGDTEHRRRYLLRSIAPLGMSHTTTPISAVLGDSDVDEILQMSTDQLTTALGTDD